MYIPQKTHLSCGIKKSFFYVLTCFVHDGKKKVNESPFMFLPVLSTMENKEVNESTFMF